MARESNAVTLALRLIGNAKQQRAYLETPNFALGGMTPMELLQTSEGEQLVLNELQMHLESGPV